MDWSLSNTHEAYTIISKMDNIAKDNALFSRSVAA